MAGIDINSMDENWKKYAQKADELKRESDEKGLRGNNIFDLDSVFEKQAFIRFARADKKSDEQIKEFFKNSGADMQDINQIFQVELSNAKAQEATPNKKSVERANNASEGHMTSAILREGSRYYTNKNGTLTDTVNWSGIASAFVNYFAAEGTEIENKEYYKTLSNEVAKVADIMKSAKYNKREDVEKLESQLKPKLDALGNDKFSEFRKHVFNTFLVLAEQHQKDKEQQILKWEFQQLRKSGKSREEAYKTIQDDKRFQGSYYTSYQTREYKDMGNARVYGYPGLVAGMEDSIILDDARDEVFEKVWAQRGKAHLTTSKQVEDEAKKYITDDKYTAKVMRGELSTREKLAWQRSIYKDLRKAVAAYNRVENNKAKAYSRDDFYHQGFKGKKADSKFNQLSQSGVVIDKNGKPVTDKDGNPVVYNPLITRAVDENGKPMTDKAGNPLYNLSKLSDLIKEMISPADLRANAQDKHMSEHAEIENVIKEIKAKTCVKYDGGVIEGVEISYEDACHLIDMCGFDRDKKDVGFYLRAAGNAAIDTISDMAASAASALIVGAVQGDPIVHAVDAVTHVTDPEAHAVTNIDAITQALLGMTVNLGKVDPKNGFRLDLDWKITARVNGEEVDVGSAIKRYDIKEQLDDQLLKYKSTGITYDIKKLDDGIWHLFIDLPSEPSYDDKRCMSGILSCLDENFDLKSSTGVEFQAEAVIDKKGEVVTDKPAEAVVDDKGQAETTNRLEAFLLGTAIGYGLNFLKQCLKGLPPETEITNTDVTDEDLTSYEQTLSMSSALRARPQAKEILLNIARSFRNKDGSWNREGYQAFLKRIAGKRSVLNLKELVIAAQDFKSKSSTLNIKPPEEPQKPVENKPAEPVKQAKPKETVSVRTPGTEHEPPEFVYSAPVDNSKQIKTNYDFGHKHTWQGIAAMYDDCKKHGHTQAEIVRAIKTVNGIDINDNVIPQHLYLPDYLFGENDGKKVELSEAQIKAREKGILKKEDIVKAKDVRSHGTNIRSEPGERGWIGFKGTKSTFPKQYTTPKEAEDAARKL